MDELDPTNRADFVKIFNGVPAAYIGLIPLIVEAAKECGYAIGLHGSLSRDMDLIAAPWVEDVESPEVLARAVEKAVNAKHTDFNNTGNKPHGRLVYTITVGGGGFIDLSVLPKGAD